MKCPKRVLQNHERNPLIFQAEHCVNLLAEKVYLSGHASL